MNTKEKRLRISALKTELQRLQEAVAIEESLCPHEWGKTVYDPEHYREPFGHKLIAMGSDCYSEPEGYRDATLDRWSRTCILCGKKEYTKTQKPAGLVPDFGK
jgi:hypothetical protein